MNHTTIVAAAVLAGCVSFSAAQLQQPANLQQNGSQATVAAQDVQAQNVQSQSTAPQQPPAAPQTNAPPAQPTQAAPPQPAASQPGVGAAATRAYFNQVCEVLDRALTQPAAKAEPDFYSNAANKITGLPKANVDPDVVAWGGTVSLALTNAANALQVGKQRSESRADSVPTPGALDTNDPNRQERARVDVQNAQQQRRQGALEERARASEQVASLFANLQDARTRIAADLTARYGAGQP